MTNSCDWTKGAPLEERAGPISATIVAIIIAAAVLLLPRWKELFATAVLYLIVLCAHLTPSVIWARLAGVGVRAIGIGFTGLSRKLRIAGTVQLIALLIVLAMGVGMCIAMWTALRHTSN